MRRIAITALIAVGLAFPVLTARADKEPEPGIKVEIVGTLETGVVAIGGETTGTVIHVQKITWELDLGNNPDFIKLAKELDKKTALVTGTYYEKMGVEIKTRKIVKVTSLKAAEGK